MEDTKKHTEEKEEVKEEIDEESVDQQFENENLQCRLYRKDFPEENDLVIVLTNSPSLMHLFYRLRS